MLDEECKVCSLVQIDQDLVTGPSPSKISKLSHTTVVSPSDKMTKKSKRKQTSTAGLASVRLDFEKGLRMIQDVVEFKEPVAHKIYSETKEKKAFDIQYCVEADHANLLKCQLYQNFLLIQKCLRPVDIYFVGFVLLISNLVSSPQFALDVAHLTVVNV